MAVSQQVIEVLDYLGEKLGIVIDWGTENVLPYVQELIRRIVTYKIVSLAIPVVACLIILIIAIIFFKNFIKLRKQCLTNHASNIFWDFNSRNQVEMNFGWSVGLPFVIFGFLVVVVMLFLLLNRLIQWIIIPEVPIIELVNNYIQNL